MEKNFISETVGNIQFFSGFYESIWSPECELSYYEDEEDCSDDDYDFDNDQYEHDVCQAVADVWGSWLKEYISEDIEVEFRTVQSPAYYNYSTDKCETVVKLTKKAQQDIMAKVAEHHDQIAAWISKYHKSYSGFISFLEDDIEAWNENALFNSEEYYQPAYLFCMLDYILRAEFKKNGWSTDLDETCYEMAMDDLCINTYITDKRQDKEAA